MLHDSILFTRDQFFLILCSMEYCCSDGLIDIFKSLIEEDLQFVTRGMIYNAMEKACAPSMLTKSLEQMCNTLMKECTPTTDAVASMLYTVSLCYLVPQATFSVVTMLLIGI